MDIVSLIYKPIEEIITIRLILKKLQSQPIYSEGQLNTKVIAHFKRMLVQ